MPARRPARARPARRRERASTHPVNRRRLPPAVKKAVERLRAICLALPDATEKIAWGEPTWRAGKIFAQMDTYHHGAEHVAVWLPARPGVQRELVDEDPVHFFVPPYVGHKGWIGIRIDRNPDWRVVEGLVAAAYRDVASPRARKAMDEEATKPRGWRAPWLEDATRAHGRRRERLVAPRTRC
jgi:hypothetical protein